MAKKPKAVAVPDKPVVRKFGWRPDKPDWRDHNYSLVMRLEFPATLPSKVDLSKTMDVCDDQGELGSCTAHGITALLEYQRAKQKLPKIQTSRLFVYYNERAIENTINEDAGAEIRDGIKSVGSTGYCDESLWPYDIDKFKDKPPQACYDQAQKMKAIRYFRLTSGSQMKGCLAAGYPFVFGSMLYQSFYDAEKTGVVPMPGAHDSDLGGHCMSCFGYDDSKQAFLVRNSWGPNWGPLKGYCWIPYAYLQNTNLSDDFWTIRSVS